MTTNKRLGWCKTKCEGTGCDGGQNGTAQKRVYALAVTVALMGAPVCICGAPVSLYGSEVDRTAPGCYRPGFVVMVCHDCNNDRTHRPEFDAAAYAADVWAASQGIPIMPGAAAKRLIAEGANRGATLKRTKYWRG